ncbi:leukocyte immunoglobulin-like receptor subfamily A member 4 [Monodelphis domestica]|uniref:leukocyte immunoglobulin-like receptor subfamily A member 4 n=1 Tax=Monodelphis domestica TaxID=13616 RepID=UPI0024E27236|nr:leukocyte immunoglobulin-like receptor subfamily A member 4 [Monodelphis domestica]
MCHQLSRTHKEEGEEQLVREAPGGDTVQSWPWCHPVPQTSPRSASVPSPTSIWEHHDSCPLSPAVPGAVSLQEDKDPGSRHSSYGWAELSDALELVVTGLSAPPSLAALPSSAVVSGQNVTLQCWSELYYGWFALCKDREEISGGRTRSHGRMYQADFFFPAVTLTNNGSYGCFGYHSSSPSLWSSPSAPLVLWVSGTFSTSPESENKPSDAAALDYTVGNLVRLILAGLVLILLRTSPRSASVPSPTSIWDHHDSCPFSLPVPGSLCPALLAALPGSEVASGQSVTLQCRSELYHDWCVLCKEGEEIRRGRTRRHGRGLQADFFFPAVTPTHVGAYICFGFNSSSPSLWSSPSAPLLLRVSGTFSTSPASENKPSDAAALDYTVGNLVRIILAGLILILLGVLLAEHWKSSRKQLVQGVLC